jgi:hypothetical protein
VLLHPLHQVVTRRLFVAEVVVERRPRDRTVKDQLDRLGNRLHPRSRAVGWLSHVVKPQFHFLYLPLTISAARWLHMPPMSALFSFA